MYTLVEIKHTTIYAETGSILFNSTNIFRQTWVTHISASLKRPKTTHTYI